MPTEIRHLMFRPPEVAYAVRLFYQLTGKSMPAGTIESCLPEGDGKAVPICVRIKVVPPPGATGPVTVVIDDVTMTGLLLQYCTRKKIPMAARASKSLQRFGDQLCLVATLNPRQEDLPPTPQA